jgi:hypothetical protein
MLTSFTQKWKLLLSLALILCAGQFLYAQSGIEITGGTTVNGSYYGSVAFFSGDFTGQSGELVVVQDTSANPTQGCFELTNDLTGKVALVDRGGCAFETKAFNAQDAGAIAVVLCNNVPDLPYQAPGFTQLDIPMVWLSQADCDLIKTEMPGLTATMLAPNPNESTLSATTITDGTHTAPDMLSGNGTVFVGATHGLWYKYITNAEGLLNINSCGGGADSRLIVIPGESQIDVATNIFINGVYLFADDGCDDGSGNDVAEDLSFLVYPGESYYIHWDNANDSTGFDFNVNLGALPTIDATFTVDMSNETVSGEGVYFNWADPADLIPMNQAMTDNGDGTWSTTLSIMALDTIGYFFSNGLPNDLAKFEVVPAACGVEVDVAGNTVYVRPYLAGVSPDPGIVCFGSCDPCPPPACANPDAIFCDDVENYALGDVSAQAAIWSPWPGGASAVVSDEQAASGAQSVKVEGGGTVDQLLLLGDSTQGNYRLSWKFYIPAGNGGYFNYQKEEGNPGGEFGMQLDFAPDGTATLDATAPAITTFAYPQDEWFDVVSFIDLDNDVIRLLVAGDVILEWPYSATTFDPAPSIKQLGSINFYPADADYVFYIDDVEFVKLQPQDCNPNAIICDGFEWYVDGSRTGSQADYWSTWSGTVGGAEDGLVTTDEAADGNNSMLIAEGQTQDVLLLLGNTTEGHYLLRWDMYIPAGKTGYFNVQEDEMPGVQWNLDVYLNRDGNAPGEGELDGLGVTFTYPEDQWFSVVHEIDLDNDLFEMWVDGNPVGVLPFADNLGAINFFSVDADNRYYLDNVELIALPSCLEDAIICDPIEAYQEGDRTGTQADYWSTWSGTVGGADDGLVTTEQSFSADNSVLIAEGQTQDVLLLLGDQTEGRYELSWKMYMPTDKAGYYNLQESETPGVAWNLEVSFGADNLGNPTTFGEAVVAQDGTTFNYDQDSWLDIVHVIDLDNDECTLTINGTDITTIPYTGNLGAVNFFSINDDNRYYLDDILFRSLPPIVETVNVTFNADAQLLIDAGTLDASGLWIAGSFNGFNGEQMTDNGDGTYSFTAEVDPGQQYTYKFQNGQGNWENIDVSQGDDCVTGANNDRFVDVADMDIEVDLVCYNYCIACDEVVSIDEVTFQKALSVFPNPAQGNAFVNYELPEAADLNVQLVNNLGQMVQNIEVDGALNGTLTLDLGNVPAGFYMLQVTDGTNQFTEKLVVEK